MSLLSMLTDTCTIKRDTNSKGSTTAAPVGTFANLATGVACSVQCEGSGESFRYDRSTPNRTFSVYLLPDQDIKASDVIVPETGTYINLQLRCVGAPEDKAGRANHLLVQCERIEGVDS